MKIADKDDLNKGLAGITHESRRAALKTIKEVRDNGVLVYTKIKKLKGFQLGRDPKKGPTLYIGEVVIYSVHTTPELIFSGMIVDIVEVKVSRGTTRGEQLHELKVETQWLLIVKRLGVPDFYDIIDQFGIGSQIRFIMDALSGEAHEIRGSSLPFEQLVEVLSGGCIDANQIVKEIIGRVLIYNRNLTEAVEELKDEAPKWLH